MNYVFLYKVLFQGNCAYAAHGWARRLRRRHQRQALIRTTKAYVTASTDCLSVIAEELPIGLYIQRTIHRYLFITEGDQLSFGDAIIEVEDY